jgi:hypothetical protein
LQQPQISWAPPTAAGAAHPGIAPIDCVPAILLVRAKINFPFYSYFQLREIEAVLSFSFAHNPTQPHILCHLAVDWGPSWYGLLLFCQNDFLLTRLLGQRRRAKKKEEVMATDNPEMRKGQLFQQEQIYSLLMQNPATAKYMGQADVCRIVGELRSNPAAYAKYVALFPFFLIFYKQFEINAKNDNIINN